MNLNGTWQFRFDAEGRGIAQTWQKGEAAFPLAITVPFPWGSKLSGVPDTAPIAWYARTIEVPSGWQGQRVFLVVGASDWHTTAWLDGQKLGEHKGGYTPFEFELTPHVRPGTQQRLTLRVDDADRAFKLEGKQGYGNARGIWQTPYLEARGKAALGALHFTPDLDARKVTVEADLLEAAPQDLTLRLAFKTGGVAAVERRIPRGDTKVKFDVAIPEPRRWSLEDPFLYEVDASLTGSRARSGRGQHLLRHAQDLGGEPARHRLPLRGPQRRARVPPARARPGLSPRRLLHLSRATRPSGTRCCGRGRSASTDCAST